MRKLYLLIGVLLFSSVPVLAQDWSRVDVFGGYSYLRLDASGEHANLNGWNGQIAVNPTSWFGIVADGSGFYGTPTIAGGPVNIHLHSYLIGPRLSYHGRVTPYVQALFGQSFLHISVPGTTFTFDDSAFGMTVGGGVDVKVHDRVSIRLAQVEWLRTQLSSDTQNHMRVSTGIVIHIKKR